MKTSFVVINEKKQSIIYFLEISLDMISGLTELSDDLLFYSTIVHKNKFDPPKYLNF